MPRPEWFFFFYEQMLMFFPGYALISFGAVVVPTIFIVLLLAVPWLDRGPAEPQRAQAALRGGHRDPGGRGRVLNMMLALSRIMNFPGQ